jgi:hypothetical protein
VTNSLSSLNTEAAVNGSSVSLSSVESSLADAGIVVQSTTTASLSSGDTGLVSKEASNR